MNAGVVVSGHDVLNRWPHIGRSLRVDSAGNVEDDFSGWSWWFSGKLSPDERAAAYEQWADFYEWNLAQRANELAHNRAKRRVLETWTDNMAYLCRRMAAWTRGDSPGEWTPQHVRRPDLDAR